MACLSVHLFKPLCQHPPPPTSTYYLSICHSFLSTYLHWGTSSETYWKGRQWDKELNLKTHTHIQGFLVATGLLWDSWRHFISHPKALFSSNWLVGSPLYFTSVETLTHLGLLSHFSIMYVIRVTRFKVWMCFSLPGEECQECFVRDWKVVL